MLLTTGVGLKLTDVELATTETTSQARVLYHAKARKNPGYRWSRDYSVSPKIWGKIKHVLREGWQRSAFV